MRKVLPEVQRNHLINQGKTQLWQDGAEQALSYLMQTRKFTQHTLRKFQIGYVPSWIKSTDQKVDIHQAAGRIIYPIRNQYEQCVAISTRDWREQPLFHRHKFWHQAFEKSFYMFGMNQALESIIKSKKAILVQGQHDTMMMHQHGFTMSMGVLGSAPQLHHISFIARYCQQIFLCFDNDTGGKKAVSLAMKMYEQYGLERFGMRMYPVAMPSPQQIGVLRDKDVDPDNILKNRGKQKMLTLLRQARQNVELFK